MHPFTTIVSNMIVADTGACTACGMPAAGEVPGAGKSALCLLDAAPGPGSIFAVYSAAVRDSFAGVTFAVFVAAAVSLLVTVFLLRTRRAADEGERPAAATGAPGDPSVLARDRILIHGVAQDREGAIAEAGQLLVDSGVVDASYVDAMHQRERSVSTYMGNLLAVPHGSSEATPAIKRTGISFVRYPDGVSWKGEEVKYVVGIAGKGEDHVTLIGKIAEVFLSEEHLAKLAAAQTQDDILALFGSVHP
ncbi:MAG: hypothetical protein CSA58_10995 [Micrococcales bacterium]|nr:MAG: hypothetical protein CSB46_00705 [Micrococcales bacterium]PIE26146.1 MAG: hypothetical protein CSA58_10995 [Micrococcales bacterium]